MIEYGKKTPTKCINPITEYINEQEAYFATQHGIVTTRKATAADIARIEAEIAAKQCRQNFYE